MKRRHQPFLVTLCLVVPLAGCGWLPQQRPAAAPKPASVNGTALTAPDTAALAANKAPAYRRVESVQGTIMLSGSSAVATFARAWGSAFQRVYTNAHVNVVSKSSAAAIGDMAANPATIGMTSRPLTAAERDTYTRQHGTPPLEFKVAIDALAIFVFKDNPLPAISLAQLERVFAATPKSGAAIDRWGEVGLTGEWTQRAVNAIGFEPGRGAYDLMRELVLRGGNFNADVSAEPVSTSVVQAVGVDPGAIGYASVYYRTARTKVLAVQTANGQTAQPTEADASSGKYPLGRFLYLHLGRGGDSGASAAAREFLRFVLSEEGQNAARASGAFAIPAALAHEQVGNLNK